MYKSKRTFYPHVAASPAAMAMPAARKGGKGSRATGNSSAAVDVRKLAAASALLWRDVPVEAHAEHLARLESALDAESRKASSECKEHPLMSDGATELRKELLNNAVEGGKEMQRAMDMVKSSDFKAIHEEECDLKSLVAFPPKLHAQAAREHRRPTYKMYQNGFANLVHAERPVMVSGSPPSLSTVKAVNDHIKTAVMASTNPGSLAAKVSKQMMLGRGGGRPRVQLASVPCHAFGHALMDQISMAAVGLAEDLAHLDPVVAPDGGDGDVDKTMEENRCRLVLAAHSLFEGADVQKQVCDLYDTRRASTEANIKGMKGFLNALTKRLDLEDVKRPLAQRPAVDRVAMQKGIIGSVAANALLSAYAVRTAPVSQDKVDTYMDAMTEDYEQTRLRLNVAALPSCIDTLAPDSPLEKRLLIQNAYQGIQKSASGKQGARFRDYGAASRVNMHGVRVINSALVSAAHGGGGGRGGGRGGVSPPIHDGSEYCFDYYNDMHPAAVREVVEGLSRVVNEGDCGKEAGVEEGEEGEEGEGEEGERP
tara:strand:+ start:6105 stop:7721 length:1617 start_codon:yes stop_codon:yes gene_type:complete